MYTEQNCREWRGQAESFGGWVFCAGLDSVMCLASLLMVCLQRHRT